MILGLVVGLCSLWCCRSETNGRKPNPDLAKFPFHEGDIVFRCGRGAVSRSVLFLDRGAAFSHVGIMARVGDTWKVIHAVPGEPDFEGDPDRVKADAIEVFFDSSRAKVAAVYRIADSIAAWRASRWALEKYESHVLFDHAYDDTDSSKMYCTELVVCSFLRQGIDLIEDRKWTPNLPGFSRPVAFPSDLAKSRLLEKVYP